MLLHNRNDVLLDQSGNLGDGAFVVGVLSCKDFSSATGNIKKLRVNTGFRCTLSHVSRNKWKAQYAKRVIDFWVDRSNVKIDLFVIRRSGAKDNERPLEKLSRYTEYVSRLVDLSRRTIDGKCRLISQRHFKKDRQTQFEKMLLRRNKGIGSIVYIMESQSDLLQLLDLVVGATQASQNTTKDPIENTMKNDLILYLTHKLRTDSLAKSLLHSKCSITFT